MKMVFLFTMISVSESRKYLNEKLNQELSDREVEEVRDAVYALAGIFCDSV